MGGSSGLLIGGALAAIIGVAVCVTKGKNKGGCVTWLRSLMHPIDPNVAQSVNKGNVAPPSQGYTQAGFNSAADTGASIATHTATGSLAMTRAYSATSFLHNKKIWLLVGALVVVYFLFFRHKGRK